MFQLFKQFKGIGKFLPSYGHASLATTRLFKTKRNCFCTGQFDKLMIQQKILRETDYAHSIVTSDLNSTFLTYAEGMILYLLKDNLIHEHVSMILKYPIIIDIIFKFVDLDRYKKYKDDLLTHYTKESLVIYLFKNLKTLNYDREIINKCIKNEAKTFLNLLLKSRGEKWLDNNFLEKIDYEALNNSIKIEDWKINYEFYKYTFSSSVTSPSLQHQGIMLFTIYNEKLSQLLDQMNKDADYVLLFNELRTFSLMPLWYNPFITSELLQQWEKFSLRNFQKIVEMNCTLLFEYLIDTGVQEFKHNLINTMLYFKMSPRKYLSITSYNKLYESSAIEYRQKLIF